MSWNAGHLGQQRWAEIKTWLDFEAEKYCDILILSLQETHWKESSEFTVAGWYGVFSGSSAVASSRQACSSSKDRKQAVSKSNKTPPTAAADGLMVLFSPRFNKAQIRWKEWQTGRVLEVRAYWVGARLAMLAVYQHVWSSFKTQQDNRSDRVPQRNTSS